LNEEIARAQRDPTAALVLVDAAVMLEAGWNSRCDRLVYIHSPRPVRLRRPAEQRGWGAEGGGGRERGQLPPTGEATPGDDAVDNSGPPERLDRQVERLLREWGINPPTAKPNP